MKSLFCFLILLLPTYALSATESTTFGKIVGIESRPWGFHIQTNFAAGAANNCPVNVGDPYMYDFRHDNSNNGTTSSDEVSMLLAAFAAQTDIAFHIYGCNGTRPLIGYIRLKK
ncbi:MAG: hypothetical protein ACRBCI_15310 [Cellvibrionaceae bacterium]